MPDQTTGRPTIAELREVTQPPSVRGRRNAEHWTADAYLRRFSPYLTRRLLPTRISPNGVTVLMIVCGALAGPALLVPGLLGGLLCVAATQLQMLWDCCDGELARWRQQFSPAGVFYDKIGHYLAESLLPIGLGLRADGGTPAGWTTVGALLAVLVLYNKALNDFVHVSRAFAGLPRLEDREGVGTPTVGSVRRLRSLVRFLPFNRIYHSVEFSLLCLVAAVVDAAAGGLSGTHLLLGLAAPLGVVTVLGHLASIVTSSRLR